MDLLNAPDSLHIRQLRLISKVVQTHITRVVRMAVECFIYMRHRSGRPLRFKVATIVLIFDLRVLKLSERVHAAFFL